MVDETQAVEPPPEEMKRSTREPAALRRDLGSMIPEYTPTPGDPAPAPLGGKEGQADGDGLPGNAGGTILPDSA